MASRAPLVVRRLPGPSIEADETVILFAAPGFAEGTAMDASWRDRWRRVCAALDIVAGPAVDAEAAAAETTAAVAARALGTPPPALRRARQPGHWLLPDMDRDLATSAGRLARALLDLTREGMPPAAAVARLRRSAAMLADLAASLPSVATRPIAGPLVEAVARLGIPWGWATGYPGLVRVGEGRRLSLFDGLKLTRERNFGGMLASNKLAIKRYLTGFGLPFLRERVVTDAAAVVPAADWLGYPIAVKPVDGSLGHGLSLDVRTPAEALEAFEHARPHGAAVMFEPYLALPDFRAVVIDGDSCLVFQRVPPAVVGDGRSTIAELIAAHDRAVAEGTGSVAAAHPIGHDADVDHTLARSGLSLRSVPESGRSVTVRTVPLLHTGGHPVDWTRRLHPSIHALFRRLADLVGLGVIAIDFRAETVERAWTEQRFGILEYNSRPNLADFAGHAVIDRIVRRVAPEPEAVRLPTILVVGTEGDSGPAGLRRRIGADRLPYGLRTGGELHLGGLEVRVPTGDAHLRMTEDPTLEVAIHWAPAGEFVRHGIGAPIVDLACVPADEAAMPADLQALIRRLARRVVQWHGDGPAPDAILAEAHRLAA